MQLKGILRFVILAATFATPFVCLYVAQGMFFPFITGKNFTFRILVEIMLGAWMLLMFLDASYRPKFTWILGAAGTFLAVITIADLQGANPAKSFWSNYERMEGLITHAHLFLYFIIAGTVLSAEHLWNWFWRTSLGVSLIVAFHAFSQLAGKTEIHQSATRLDATFGNATYLAIYCLFNAFLAAFLYFREGPRSPLRWVYPVVAVTNLAVLYFTQTRGALLGVIGGSFLAALLVALFDRERPEFRKYAIGGVVGLIVLVLGFIAFKDTAWVNSSPTLQRMAMISLNDNTTKSRFMIWNMSWEGFKERPIFGWGQDNFLYVFSKHYNPNMWGQEPWFDRSHNVFFDWLIAGGSLGLLSYLSMFGAALYYIWHARKSRFTVVERAILTGMLAGYFVHNIFVFDNLTSYIVFFGVLAYLHSMNAEEAPVAPATKEEKREKRKRSDDDMEGADVFIATAAILVATAALIYFVNIRNINANLALIGAIRPETVLVDDGKGGKKISLEDVIKLGLFGTSEAREQLIQLAAQATDPRVPEDIRRKFYELASTEIEKEIAEDPENLRARSFAGVFYARYGQFDKALTHLEKSIALSPKRQSSYLDLAMLYASMGNYVKAEEVAKKAYDLAPAYAEARLAYVVALIYQKNIALAEEIMDGFDTAMPQQYDSRIVNALGQTEEYDRMVSLVNEKIARGFASARDYFALAGAYWETGRKEEAIAAVEKAMSLDATLKEQGESLIKQIRGEE